VCVCVCACVCVCEFVCVSLGEVGGGEREMGLGVVGGGQREIGVGMCASIPRRTSSFWRVKSEMPGIICQVARARKQTCGSRRRITQPRRHAPRG